MHSEVTSLAASSPARSPRRPSYYVMSPSQHDADKMSRGSSPAASPVHHHQRHPRYGNSPIHHSLESSTTRYSASMKNGPWRKIRHPRHGGPEDEDDEEDEEEEEERRLGWACYAAMFGIGFVVLFSLFSVILWGASRAYKPEIAIKGVVFKMYNIQAGMDDTGVPTKMLSINSTVRIKFRNTATFFGVYVSSSPVELYYYELKIASGHMQEFYESRKSERLVTTMVGGTQVPLYGGGTGLTSRNQGGAPGVAPLNLTIVMRASANVLGKLVRSNFYCHIRCGLVLHENLLNHPVSLQDCHYQD